ncbi:MAG TPA: hypothetical protein PKC65_04450 [Pyrinomonadaceae bacterium]|nr:hypothetical protein [Pyrinomonadaceae bacterium]
MTSTKCSNCADEHRSIPDVCILSALVGVSLFSRESLNEKQARNIIASSNADHLWDDLGPIIDRLESGFYALTEDD